MNLPDLVRNNPVYQSIFAVGSITILLIATAVMRYYTVLDRFDPSGDPASVLSRYTIVEIALLLITIGCIIFIWFFLLQGRLAGFIIFNFGKEDAATAQQPLIGHVSDSQVHTSSVDNDILIAAVEVGTNLLQEFDRPGFLTYAVNEIQQKFDIYHVQVYLTENSAKTLTLRAGSGRIGSELVRRGHRLAIGSGSINGTAAQRKETVLVSDTKQSDLFLANPLLSRTRSEISLPIQLADEFLGVLNLQFVHVNAISASLQKGLEILADQLAIALSNAGRIEELEEKQKSVTQQAARLTQIGWKNWLASVNGEDELSYIHRPFGDDHQTTDQSDDQNMFMASSIVVSGAEVGNIHIETDSNHHWGIEDIDLVRSIANQLGQRIENLRLLNESDRFREEAESALKQLTRQNWGDFTGQLDESGYLFDGSQLNEIEPDEEELARNTKLDLTVRGETVGAVTLPDDDLSVGQKAMLESIAESLSSHIENLRLTDQTRRQVFELSLLNRINSAMSAEISLYDLIEIVGAELRAGFNASSTFIAIYNRELNLMEYPYFAVEGKDGVQRIQEEPRPRGTGFSSQVIQSGKPLLISRNPAEMIRAGALVVDYGEMPHSYLGVPIIFGEEVLGVLSLQNGPDKRLFNQKDQDVMLSIANSMALTLQNSALFTETQIALETSKQRQQELVAINSVVSDTMSAVTVNEAIDRMAQKLIEIINGDLVSTALLNQSTDELVVISERNATGLSAERVGATINLADSKTQKSVLETQKTFISKVKTDPEDGPLMVILPIIGQSGAIGTVKLVQSENREGFTDSQIKLAETIVYQVSTVLENKQLLGETRNRALREQKVRAITNRIRQGADQKEILRIAKEELSGLVGAKRAQSWIGSSDSLAAQFNNGPKKNGTPENNMGDVES